MNNEELKILFLKAANEWLCNTYMIDIRYLVWNDHGISHLLEASVNFQPLPFLRDMNFKVEADLLSAGQYQLSGQCLDDSLQIIESAANGQIDVPAGTFHLDEHNSFEKTNWYVSEMIHSDRWFSDLHLQVVGSCTSMPTLTDYSSIDNSLRCNDLPFDGLQDLSTWLRLNNPKVKPDFSPSINIRVSPPVDLKLDECCLENDCLSLTLHAHPFFDVDRISLAVRAVPGNALVSRQQVASKIKWGDVSDGRRKGVAKIHLDDADSVLTILVLGEITIRRQWFIDKAKAYNHRLIAFQHFDNDLNMLKKAVIDTTDSVRFEKGISALSFLLGFIPAPQIETDAPDLIVVTPGENLVIVECTTRIADFSTKLGKLVDRKHSLSKALEVSRHYSRVYAVLVCALSSDQIAMKESELANHQVILITKEDLIEAFERLRGHNNPDEMLDFAVARQDLLRVNIRT
ncbi:MAG: hypothetical protein ACXV8O_03630 [Methylobacter sp.]